jgi:hypothetical protein
MDIGRGNVATPFGRGKTYFAGNVPANTYWVQSANIEGLEAEFDDLAPKTASMEIVKRGPKAQKCMIVRNAATIALKPGRAVVWQSGYKNRRVDGYQHAQYGEIAGIVDEHLPAAGVAVGDLFWLVRGGQVLATCDTTATAITAGAKICAATGTSSLNDDAGRIEANAITSGATEATSASEHNNCGVAVSAKATTETSGKRLLVELTLV